jgi:hypothetical protein
VKPESGIPRPVIRIKYHTRLAQEAGKRPVEARSRTKSRSRAYASKCYWAGGGHPDSRAAYQNHRNKPTLISVSLHDANNCKYRDTFQALLTTTGTYVMPVDILILGAGWTSSFLIPLCQQQAISYAATTRSGTHSTIKFVFDPDSDVLEPFESLPDATSILICFPIAKSEASKRLVNLYMKSRRNPNVNACFIQLGTSGIWDVSRV